MSAPAVNPFRGYICHVCGRQKGETNHWWMLSIGDAALPARDGLQNLSIFSRLCIAPWHRLFADDESQFPACGRVHVAVMVERFLSTGKFDGPCIAGNPPEPKGATT